MLDSKLELSKFVLMEFQIFAREGCEVCEKARQVLSRFGVPIRVRFIDGLSATVDDLADFAFFGWTDTPPLVVVTQGGRVLKRWDGNDIADPNRSWHLKVQQFLASAPTVFR